jgi:hypothetical protein
MGKGERKERQRKHLKDRSLKSNAVTLDKLTLHKLDWLEKITVGIGLWFFLYPRPYEILLGILLVIPILGLIINGLHKPSIATLVDVSSDRDGDEDYDVADFIDFPAWMIILRVLLDFEFESIESLIIPGTIGLVIVLAILLFTHKLIEKSTRNRWWIYGSLLFNISLYSYGSTYAVNCAFDDSPPDVYPSRVLEKTISGGKHATYYVKVAPWGHHLDKEEISIARSHYEELEVGDTIKILRRQGLFNIPWYHIQRNHLKE